RYQKWIDSILNSKCHIITTNRKKQAYALVESSSGGKKVEKQGMEDQMRDGYDYEMTMSFDIINDGHMARVMKDRSSIFADKPEFIITEETGKQIKAWCDKGIDAEALELQRKKEAEEKHASDVKEATKALKKCKTIEELASAYTALSVDVKAAVVGIKDEMKVKLTPAPQT